MWQGILTRDHDTVCGEVGTFYLCWAEVPPRIRRKRQEWADKKRPERGRGGKLQTEDLVGALTLYSPVSFLCKRTWYRMPLFPGSFSWFQLIFSFIFHTITCSLHFCPAQCQIFHLLFSWGHILCEKVHCLFHCEKNNNKKKT